MAYPSITDDDTRYNRGNQGQIQQAQARKNAPRGQTPNAPEVNDEPGLSNPGGQSITSGFGPMVKGAQAASDFLERVNPVNAAERFIGGQIAGGVKTLAGPAADLVKNSVYGAAGVTPANPTQYTDEGAQAAKDSLVARGVGAAQSAIKRLPDAVPTPQAPSIATAVPAAQPPAPIPQEYKPLVLPPTPPEGQAIAVQPAAPYGSDANPDAYHQQYLAMRAREDQGAQDNHNAMVNNAEWANAWTRQRDAASNQRVANFQARNGADMVLRGGSKAQKQAILANQGAANDELRIANAQEAGAIAGGKEGRNYVKENAEAGETANRALLAGAHAGLQNAEAAQLPIKGQALTQQIAAGGLSLEAQRRIGTLHTQLETETDPAKRRTIVDTLLAMQGKEKPTQFHVVRGGTDPNNPLVTLPDRVFNQSTGEFVSQPGNNPQAKTPTLDEFIAAAKADPRNKQYDDNFLKNKYKTLYPSK